MLDLIEDDDDAAADAMTERWLTHLARRCVASECPFCPEQTPETLPVRVQAETTTDDDPNAEYPW